ncbi:MAG TPA: FAD-dependent oxidoreductase, partial [Ignavibacteriaceae bacterium]|nr:FAD-dependent oxidoreductase [Ignavibacteriaceae bacterium]
HACFNALTGDVIEPPALDSLASYKIKIDGDLVKIILPDKIEMNRPPEMVKKDLNSDSRSFVIIGAGAAGNAAAQSLREAGFKGDITMLTGETRAPYDRPNLSKAYLQGEAPAEWMPLRPAEFFREYGIDIKLNCKVKSLDIASKTIMLEKGDKIKYDKVLAAPGGVPRKLNIPGSALKNIFYLRSFENADEIIDAAENAGSIAVIGSSFIGMETAISLKERFKVPVTVTGTENAPFEKVFGKEIGRLFMNEHEKHGINFKLGRKILQFEGTEKVKGIILDNNEKINAELVIAGIGVVPATDFITVFKLEKDNSIKVDKYFKASDDFFAAGDCASFPDPLTGSYIRIEHWRTAEQQGRTAAFNMAGIEKEYYPDPFFWTVQGDLTLRYVGHASDWDEQITLGEISSKEFITFFVKDDKVVAAAGSNKDKEMAAAQCLLRLKKFPSPSIMRKKPVDLMELASSTK